MPKRLDPALKKQARAMKAAGHSVREISRLLPVSEGTIKKWCADISAGSPKAFKEPEADVTDPFDIDLSDPEARLAQCMREMYTLAEEARRTGNFTASARFHSLAAAYSKDLTQVQKRKEADPDVWTAPKAEVDKAAKRVRDTVSALLDDIDRCGGLVCAKCGEKIRVSIASKGTDNE